MPIDATPGIDGPAKEAAGLGDADHGRREQIVEGELKIRLSSEEEMSLARMPATHRECGSSPGGRGGGRGPAMSFAGAVVKSGEANAVGR